MRRSLRNLAYTVIDVLCTLVWSVVIFGTVLLGIGNQVLGLGFWAILAWFCVLFFPMAALILELGKMTADWLYDHTVAGDD